MKLSKLNNLKEYYIFIWLVIISVLSIVIFTVYSSNKSEQNLKMSSSLENIYLQKTISEITNSLQPRFTYFEYSSKPGDNFQVIIEKLNINKKERNEILLSIKKEKTLKVLRINQKFFLN